MKAETYPRAARGRVLVADDDADIRDLIDFKLSAAGFEVVGVADGAAAWDAFQIQVPQMLVLDVQMPKLTGLEVLARVRAIQPAHVPVMMLSARSQDSEVDAALAAGADDYLIKPFSPRELAQRAVALVAKPPPRTGAGTPRSLG